MIIFWALSGIFVLFVLFSFIRKPLHSKFGFSVCSICAAVSITWLSLILLKLAGMKISDLLIGILMGESLTGIMYLFENKAKLKGHNNILWLKVVIILIGTLLVYLSLAEGASSGFVIVAIIAIILAIIIYKKLSEKESRKIGDEKNIKTHNRFRKEIEKLEERFEHCCD